MARAKKRACQLPEDGSTYGATDQGEMASLPHQNLTGMRVLKTILIILAVLAALFVILGLMGSKTFRVERTTTIAAPASAVYANVSSLANMDKWGPWKEEEPDMTAQLSG